MGWLNYEPTARTPVDWRRAAPDPIALVILPWSDGVTIAKLDASGALHGCRDVTKGPHFDSIVAAWIADAMEQGLAVLCFVSWQ